MSNYIALTKILLKNSVTTFTTNRKTGKSSGKAKNIILMIVLILSMLPLVGAIGAMVWNAYPIFAAIQQEGLILATGLLMVSMMVLFFGIFYVMNVFYFSKDVEVLLPLPLRPSTIMAAKFTVTLLYEYLTELLLLLPVLVPFGIVSNASPVFYLYALIAFLTLPIVPLVYAGIINIVLMKVTNIGKNRDQIRIVGGMVAMFGAIFLNIKMQSFFSNVTDPEQIKSILLSGNNSMLGLMTSIFPANKLLTLSLINSDNIIGLVNLLIYLGIVVLFMALFLTLGESWYFKGVMGMSETVSKRRKLSKDQLEKSIVKSPVMKSYTLKELKLLFRTPVYFINCVLTNFIWPVVLFVALFSNSEGGNGVESFQEFIKTGVSEGTILAVAFAAILFASGSNGVASTAISREGGNIFINKYMPVSYHEQIMAKVMSAVILGLIALFSMMIAFVYIAGPSLYMIVMIIVSGTLGVLFSSLIGILIDLNFPKLNWDNEQKAVKQNMNVIVHMLVSIVAAAAITVPCILLKLNIWIVFAGEILIFGFANAILYGLIKAVGERLFEKMEP